jgi:hypothetical protein
MLVAHLVALEEVEDEAVEVRGSVDHGVVGRAAEDGEPRVG